MEFKAFSFEQNNHMYAEVKSAVADAIDNTTIYFESYSDSKALFNDIGNALETADVLLIGVEPKAFLKFKPVIIKAFNFTPAYSDKILKLVSENVSDENVQKAHALIPKEAEELVAESGLYSGFFVKEDNQYIVIFPLSENEAPKMLMVPQLPFFKQYENKSDILQEIVSKDEASPKASTIVNKLINNNFKIALPSTPSAKILKTDIKACENYSDYVFFTPFVNDTGVTDPKQYAAQLAKGAKELRSTELGGAISNIFREKKGDKVISYYTFVSIATEDKVVVKKLFANSDESIDNLLTEATAELYAMIDKYVDEIAFKLNASPEEKSKYESDAITAEVVSDVRPEASISKAGVIVAIIAIILAIVACVILALKFGDYFVKPTDVPSNESIQQAGQTQQNDIPPATLPQIPANTVAEITQPESTTNPFDVTTTEPTTQPFTMPNFITPNQNNGNGGNNNQQGNNQQNNNQQNNQQQNNQQQNNQQQNNQQQNNQQQNNQQQNNQSTAPNTNDIESVTPDW